MTASSHPQSNLLAVTGLVADPKGKLVTLPRGALNFSWLYHISAETARRGRERLARGEIVVDRETLIGWFCLAEPSDLLALEQLEQRAWRKSLKTWKARDDERWAVHNRATLHRLMYLAEDSESRGAHLRKAAELYGLLAKQGNAAYRPLADWSFLELKAALWESHKLHDDDMVARSLRLIEQLQGMEVCEELQEGLFLDEVDDLGLLCATLLKELLPYQGVVHVPSSQLLEGTQQRVELEVLPAAERLRFRMVAGSRQQRRVETMVAELCGLLSQSFHKAGDGHSGKKWATQSSYWDRETARVWHAPPQAQVKEEPMARVEFSESEVRGESEPGPRSFGNKLFGLYARPSLVRQHESREEWLEALRLLGVALFPTRRFAMYRNLDTGELGHHQRLPLRFGHTVWQLLVVVIVSFALLGIVSRGKGVALPSPDTAQATPLDPAQRAAELDKAVGRLKRLAETEAQLRKEPTLDTQRLQAIERERQELFNKVERLEQNK